MKLSVPVLLMFGAGVLLLWAGITNRHPAAVMKAILTGQKVPGAGTWK